MVFIAILSYTTETAYADSQLTYAQVNGQTLSTSNPVVTVSPGASLTGTINVDLKDPCSSCVLPSVGINSWDRNYYADLGGISGDNQWHTKQFSFSFVAPSSIGTYYIAVGYSGCYAAADVVYGCYGLGDPRRGQPGGGDDIWDTANWESMMPANQPSGMWRAIKIIVQPSPTFDFSISVSPNSVSIAAGSALTTAGTVTLNPVSGSTQPVTLLLSGLPSNVGTHDLEGLPSNTCSPPCSISFGIGTYSSAPSGTYTLTITGTGGGKTHSTTYTLVVLGIPSDTTPPTISISSPLNGQSSSTNTITVTGTASDNVALNKVEVKVGTGSWQLASGTTSWSGQVTLYSGSNTISARATDTSGNTNEASVIVTHNPPVTTGSISVSSIPSGASIYLDSSYRGETPKDITDASVGSHYIELKLDDYKPWSDTIDVKAGSVSYVSATLTSIAKETITPTITTTAPTSTSGQPPTNASVNLHGEKTDVVLGEDILLKLSAVNLITKPKMHVQVIIIPPSGMSVASSEFSKSGAGQFTANYELEPGDGKDIEVRIKSNQVGDFNVNGRIVYYFGDEKDKSEDYTLNLPIKVRPAQIAQTPIPGFGVLIGLIGLFLALILKKIH
ncbi:MAG: PEGA domain-containing protein [Candidatus Methanoperedens sp.]|nr:PEGA domain-containing protein [Candidatus Methanoperedens sp.]